MPEPAGSIIERLRTETRIEHDAIEATLDWQARASDRARYRRWLERLYGFHRVWEPAVADALADATFFDQRRKLTLLADDLAGLGIQEPLDKLPTPPEAFRFGSEAAALGSLYVLEGSMLGGKLIARHVAAQLGHMPLYHDAYGSRTGAMWREFQARLQTRVRLCEHDDVIGAAKDTFSRLRSWL